MLDFYKRMMMIALRDRLTHETGSTARATVIAEHAFGWTLTEAEQNMEAIKHAIIVDTHMVSKMSSDSYLLETGEHSVIIDDEYLATVPEERRKVLKRAMIHLNPVH